MGKHIYLQGISTVRFMLRAQRLGYKRSIRYFNNEEGD